MRRTVAAAFGLLALTVAAGTASAGAAPRAPAVTITVHAAASGQVGSGFAGFSYEKDRVGAGVFDTRDTNLVKLFQRLGPSVLRLGGNLVDKVNWHATGKGGSAKEIAPADVTKLAGFLKATGWKAIYGINLKTNTPANAASEAQFAAKALGGGLLAFEIGNEPNFYRTEATYETSFNSYVTAIRAKVPGAAFDGPGTASKTAWLQPFASHEKVAILSMHTYVGTNSGATIAAMLASTQPGGRLPGEWTALQKAKQAHSVPVWRMTEANSFFHGGAAGVSDVQAAALWTLDFLYGTAAHDGSGVNFHGGTSSQFPLHYSPIVFNGLTPTGVQAVYYGELLWTLAGTGPLHNATVSGASGVTAFGIGHNAIVDNKGGSAVTATVTLPATVAGANAYVLTAPSLTSKAITIGGSGVAADGSFHPVAQPLPVSGGTHVTLTVPAGSAVLIATS